MENKTKHQDVESAVVSQLSNANLSKAQLSDVSKSIVSLQRAGFQVVDWTMFGRPAFEKLLVETHLPAEKAASLQNLFTGTGDQATIGSAFKEIFIYRKGIPPMPNFFNVKVAINAL